MSKRRTAGEWVRLKPYSGFVVESDRLRAEIQPEEDEPAPCLGLCDDDECREWATLLTERDPLANDERHMLCHVSECQMLDCGTPGS